jgi:hypothetical protein
MMTETIINPTFKSKESSSNQSVPTVAKLREQSDEVKLIMLNNIETVIKRGEDIDSLDTKAKELSEHSSLFGKYSRELNRKMWCKNMKFCIILIIVLLIIIFLIIVPIAVSYRHNH